jgi:hypothetical protein
MVIDRRLADGRRLMTIEHDQEVGFRIWASRFGRHIVSNDGLHVESALPAVPAWRWQRLLFAQVLPLAAALRGLDPFHASGVVLGDKALAFVAASGTGKTSIAANLVGGGASFLTDDVLSVELSGGEVIAHPGPAMASIAPEELAAMNNEERARLGPGIGSEHGKKHVKPSVVSKPHRLAAFFFLIREPDVERLQIEPMTTPDPRMLLGSSFINYIRSDDHLVTHLETCAKIAEAIPVFWLRIPPRVSASAAAAAVRDRVKDIA